MAVAWIITTIMLALLLSMGHGLAATTCQSILLPSYFTVGPGSLFFKIFADHAARTRTATITIGPCGDFKNLTPCVRSFDPVDPKYVAVVDAAKLAGVKVLAYIDIDEGTRPSADIKAEIALYRSRYRVDGVFFDQMPNATDDAAYFRFKALSDYVRDSFGGFVVLNFGAQPHREHYFRIADVIVTFEGPYTAYVGDWTPPPAWMWNHPAAKIAHLVHTVPASTSAMNTVVTLSQARNAGLVYVTDAVQRVATDNPWNRLPIFWQAELDRLRSGCRQPTG